MERVKWLDSMVMPTIAVLAIVVGYPIVYTIILSTQDYNLVATEAARFVGADNYRKLVGDPIFWQSLRSTALYTFGSVAISAYRVKDGAMLAQSGPFVGRTLREDFWFLGTGPSTVIASPRSFGSTNARMSD